MAGGQIEDGVMSMNMREEIGICRLFSTQISI